MLSKGGKIEYSCPQCGSSDIRHRQQIGDLFTTIIHPWLTTFNSAWCHDCDEIFPWAARIKHSLRKRKEKWEQEK